MLFAKKKNSITVIYFNYNFYSFLISVFFQNSASDIVIQKLAEKRLRAATVSFVRILRFRRKNCNIYRAAVRNHLPLNRTNSRVLTYFDIKIAILPENYFLK